MNKIQKNQLAVSYWLMICTIFVVLMVAVGGYTRLSNSGLSIVEWKPITGTLPPFSSYAWEEEFKKYKATPEYIKINYGMSMEEFKDIYWVEYLHRLLGRILGIVFIIPFLYFISVKAISKSLALKLAGVCLLGAMQGLVGWLMVRSGLVDLPRVSSIKLAMHLGIAFIIFSILLSFTFQQRRLVLDKKALYVPKSFYFATLLMLVLVFIQVILGAFVAGLDAGLIFNTFPKMNGDWIPGDAYNISPWWVNIFADVTSVQLNHRWFAKLLGVLAVLYWIYGRSCCKSRPEMFYINFFMAAFLMQFALGIATLLSQVEMHFAMMHQLLALILLGSLIAIKDHTTTNIATYSNTLSRAKMA